MVDCDCMLIGSDPDGSTLWQSINLEESDFERNAVDLSREIIPLLEAALAERGR